MSVPMPLAKIVSALTRAFGTPPKAPARGAFQLVLWENVGYLVDDERRAAVFERLKTTVGLTPAAILAARRPVLVAAIADGGMRPADRAAKLVRAAEIAEAIGDDLDALVRRAPAAAKKALKRFPGIGEPGAEKILLLAGGEPVLGLDSNGLRVLVRLGYGTESKSYGATYKSVKVALGKQTAKDGAFLARAHQLLREHGRTVCRRTRPECGMCPLSGGCRFYAETAGG
jgi:endonuclease III